MPQAKKEKEVKIEAKLDENVEAIELTDEELASVVGGISRQTAMPRSPRSSLKIPYADDD